MKKEEIDYLAKQFKCDEQTIYQFVAVAENHLQVGHDRLTVSEILAHKNCNLCWGEIKRINDEVAME